jgi:DNA-binding transcriptional MerR regulator
MITNTRTSTMHIGELADRTGLSLRTIRHYDEVGLLPASSRTEGGFRVYTEADCERLLVIKQMKPLGFSLEEMAELIPVLSAGPDGLSESSRARLAEFLEKAVHQRAKLARNLAQADQLIERLGQLA